MTRPLSQADLLRDEIDILYAISNQLTRASTPAEWLKAVSAYAHQCDACAGAIYWINQETARDVADFEVAAEWIIENRVNASIGIGFQLNPFSHWLRQWAAFPDQPMLIRNLADIPDMVPDTVKFDERICSVAILPLNIKNRWIGALLFAWDQPYPFDERDRRIFTAMLQQAAPVIDSMRQFEQNRERASRAEQLLRVTTALSQATNEEQILAAVALYVEQHEPVAALTLQYANIDENGHPAGLVAVAERVNGQPQPVVREPLAHQAESGPDGQNEVIFIEHETSGWFTAYTRQVWPQIQACSGVYMPLWGNGHWQGAVVVRWPEPRAFSVTEKYMYRAIRQNIAAVVASRRAYLAEQAARQERELLFQASAAINAATTFEELTQAVAKLNFSDGQIKLSLFENYDFDQATYLEVVAEIPAHTTGNSPYVPLDTLPILSTNPDQRVLIHEHITTNPAIDAVSRATFLRNGIQSNLDIRLWRNAHWMGILSFNHPTLHHYTVQEIRLLEGMGSLVEAAIERFRLRYETEAARERAERYASEAQKVAALEERNRLARELHDSVSQALYGIVLGVRTAYKLLERDPAQIREPLDYVLSLAEAGLTEMRALIFDLRPDALINEGLIAALDKQAKSIQARHGIEVMAQFCSEPAIPDKTKEELYRIIREALHNAVKHARANRITINMDCQPDSIVVEIQDDGVGFDLQDSFPGHVGLKSMWERARRLGGDFDVVTGRGKGTRVQLSIRKL